MSVVGSTTGLYSLTGGTGGTGAAYQWKHGCRGLNNGETYVPHISVAQPDNQYQFVVNSTGIDGTFLYCNVLKFNQTGTATSTKTNSYGGPIVFAWIVNIIGS